VNSAGLEELLRENQCGFRMNRACIDQLHSLHCIMHNRIEFNLPLYINFIDFKAAFDSINRDQSKGFHAFDQLAGSPSSGRIFCGPAED
jgi:hypothetical protein